MKGLWRIDWKAWGGGTPSDAGDDLIHQNPVLLRPMMGNKDILSSLFFIIPIGNSLLNGGP